MDFDENLKLPSQNRVLLHKLMVPQLSKHFMQSEDILPCSLHPAMRLYFKPAQFN